MKKSEFKKLIKEEVFNIREEEKTQNIPNYDKLPATRDDVNWSNRVHISLPAVDGQDYVESLFSKTEVDKWVDAFKKIYGEDPIFKSGNEKLIVTNPKFVKKQQQWSDYKSAALKKYKYKD